MRLKAKWFSCTLINVHTATNKKMEVVNEQLCNLLEQNINQIANYLLTIYYFFYFWFLVFYFLFFFLFFNFIK